MPYRTNEDLPPSVARHLPAHAQDIDREAFNHAFAAHERGAAEVLADPAVDRLIVTDTVPPFRLGPDAPRHKIEVTVAPLLAEAIRRLHEARPLTDLFVF